MPFCPTCGKENKADTKFCYNCGSSLNIKQEGFSNAEIKSSKSEYPSIKIQSKTNSTLSQVKGGTLKLLRMFGISVLFSGVSIITISIWVVMVYVGGWSLVGSLSLPDGLSSFLIKPWGIFIKVDGLYYGIEDAHRFFNQPAVAWIILIASIIFVIALFTVINKKFDKIKF